MAINPEIYCFATINSTTHFQEAGIEDFSQFRDKDFNVESLQAVNLDGLMDYIKKGQQAEQVQEKEFAEFLGGCG
ncbi:MAG: hypothetical protein ACOC0R_04600, partial [Mariniphaga sp.]